tara:strand:- start:1891 stop:1995 length:105 start_codon:yes stop_codon:yes gene_type:complete
MSKRASNKITDEIGISNRIIIAILKQLDKKTSAK